MDRIDQETLELFIEHFENSPYKKIPDEYDVEVEGGNPGCGDIVKIYLKVEPDNSVQVFFQGEGCTISQASTSLLIESIEGKKFEEIENLDINHLINVVGKQVYTIRPNCASLGLNVLKAAIRKYKKKNIQL
ncbi:MAG: iron-sulfur cluster assembly scaffold protein [bacterium]